MRRADRLFAIIQTLRGGRSRRAEDIAQILEVSPRTIYRDIADLQAQNVPIDGERGVGYILRDDYFLPPLRLTLLEMEALSWGVAFVATHGDEALSAAAQELAIKLRSASPSAVHHQPSASAHGNKLNSRGRAQLKILREAIMERQKIDLTYSAADGALTERILRPLGLEHWGHVWTLTAWCELRDSFRVFRIDRIDHIVKHNIKFQDEHGKTMSDYIQGLSVEK